MALFGYARVATSDQDVRGQHDQLEAAGCTRLCTETASGALAKRPQLDAFCWITPRMAAPSSA